MKPYIMLNNKLRVEASKNKKKFEVDFYKLMPNSCYGKTMENVRNRINFRLINTETQALGVRHLKRYIYERK